MPMDRLRELVEKESRDFIGTVRKALHPMPPTSPPGMSVGQLTKNEEKMFAIMKSGGRQYKVTVGQKLEVNRLPYADGEQIEIPEILLISDADRSLVGAPFLENALILATVDRQARGEKLIVFKYKSKKRYRHKRGHRQELTILNIDDIVSEGKSLVTGEAPKRKEQSSTEE
jgi:large subunit ribosomal protein L21